MKKEMGVLALVLAAVLLFIYIFNLNLTGFAVSADSSMIQFTSGTNASFSQGETILASVSGNFINPLTKANIHFYRDGHVSAPALTDVMESNGEFYLYGILGNYAPGNYTLSLENVKYMKGAQISTDAIKKNFTITNRTADFSINPGLALSDGTSFSFKLQNLQEGKITVGINAPQGISSTDGASLGLQSGETKTLSFQPENSSGFGTIDFSSANTDYSIPISIQGVHQSQPLNEFAMGFEPSTISLSMATSSSTQRIIYLQNKGKTDITNITMDLSTILVPYVTVSPEVIDTLKANSTKKITLTIKSDSNEATLQGNLFANSENVSSSLVLVADFVQNYVPPNGSSENNSSQGNSTVLKKCSDLQGIICGAGETCSGNTADTADGTCCLATCQQTASSGTSSTSKWIGWALIILIILLVFWFFKRRYRKVKNKIDFMKIAKGKR